MKWFQHSVDSHDDPDISDAEDLFGDAGYNIFFKILELYGREFNSLDEEGNWIISQTFLRRKLRKTWTKVEQTLNFYQERERIFYSTNGTQVTIKIPQFIDIASNWTKRPKRHKSQNLCSASVVSTAHRRRREEEKEKEEEGLKKDRRSLPQKDRINNPEIKQFIDYYHNTFLERFNEKPMIQGGKDGKIIKALLMTYKLDVLKDLLDKFFNSTDPFILQSGYSMGVFTTQINKLIAGLKVDPKNASRFLTIQEWRPKNER